ncbi:MAG TPA: UDP-N-acetylmuramate dehydrogenase [Spirochaetota bacterium]|nr:UDP-N-acetylmuramate dehydrogenase [Spirochaetota bacterium]
MMADSITMETLYRRLIKMGTAERNVPMKNYTTFKTGGLADIVFCPGTREQLRDAVALMRAQSVPVTVIGGGSNLLVSDDGIRGVVVRLACDNGRPGLIRLCGDELVCAGAEAGKREFVNFCLDAGLEGMEFLAGMPGCIGGGIVMNAGTNMGTFADILETVEFLDGGGLVQTMEVTRDKAHYRKIDLGDDAIVLGGYFRLRRASDPDAARNTVSRLISERGVKHPLGYPSAGSVFKNPDGYSSWKLINDAGLKGKRIGGAMVSELHTNFIINVDNATSEDVRSLIVCVQNEVYARFGVRLEPEVKLVGEF